MPHRGGVLAGNTYDKYGTQHGAEKRLMAAFLSSFDAMVAATHGGLGNPSMIIEVGVGEGMISARLRERFPGAAIVGLDLYGQDLVNAWQAEQLTCCAADARNLPLPDKIADLVVGLEVLEHVEHPERALDEMARICRDAVILSVPREPIWRAGNIARGRYLRQLGNTPGHVNHWTSRSFRRFVATRFVIDEVSTPLPWTMLRGRPR